MKKEVLTGLVMLVCLQTAFAEDLFVDKSLLKDLSTKTQKIQESASFSGQKLMAQVDYLIGSPYVFKSPINVQQIEYLKANGAKLNKGDVFARIKGPEVHHFYTAFVLKKRLFKQATLHFQNSEKLYANKSIGEKAWLDISNEYYSTQMEIDELNHFFELVLNFDEDIEALTLIAPIEGSLQYSITAALDASMTIASFVPSSAIRVKVNIPATNNIPPMHFVTDDCELGLDYVETSNSGFHRTIWTKTISSKCNYTIGQILSVAPVYKTNAFKVNKSSVVSFDGSNYIFIESQSGYQGVKVQLLTAQGDDYIVYSKEPLVNKVVLVSSVSAVQGILQGLGL